MTILSISSPMTRTMAEPSWYEVVDESVLRQGDILLQCAVAEISADVYPLPQQVAVEVGPLDLIVLSQSCDLEHDKVDSVLLAQVVAWSVVKSTYSQNLHSGRG